MMKNTSKKARRIAGYILVIMLNPVFACADEVKDLSAATSQSENDGLQVMDVFAVGENVYVRSLAVDKNTNALWVGTSVGVLEVDLKSENVLNTYTRSAGLANEYVFALMVDQQGKKWFGTNGGGVSTLDGQRTWNTYFPMHGLADYWVYSFAQADNGDTWIGTWAGVNLLQAGSGKFTTYLTELVNEWVYGIAIDSQQRVWFATEGGVTRFDGQDWKSWTHTDGLGASNEGNLPISLNTGLGTRSRHNLSVMNEGEMTYNPNYVFSIMVDDEDQVWVGTWGGGVSFFNGKEWRSFTVQDGLASNIVYSVAQDQAGTYWFGTHAGLSRYDGKSWRTFDRQDGLLGDAVYAVVTTDKDEVWLGSRGGVAHVGKK